MRIGIDLDNVVVNTTEAVIEYLNERVPNLHLKMDDIKEYWMEKNLPPGYSLLVQEAFESKHMWKKVKMIKGAKKFIRQLREDGHEIYFVTSSLPENLRKKIKHLTRELAFYDEDYVWKHTINIHKKQLINLDVLIDDCLDNLTGDKTYKSICFDYPWNRQVGFSEDMERCKDWAEIYETIRRISRHRIQCGQGR